MTNNEQRIAWRAAKQFAARIRASNWAEFVPDDWESMSDEQIKHAMDLLPSMGLVKRVDQRWERR